MKRFSTNLRLMLVGVCAACLGMSAWAGLKSFVSTQVNQPVSANVTPAKVMAAAPAIDYTATGNYQLFWDGASGPATSPSDFGEINTDSPWGFYRYSVEDGTYAKFTTYDNKGKCGNAAERGIAWYSLSEYCFVSSTGHFHPKASDGVLASPAIMFTAPADGIYYATITVWRDKADKSNPLVLRSRCLKGSELQCDKSDYIFAKGYGTKKLDGVDGKQPQTLDFYIKLNAGQRFTFETEAYTAGADADGRTHIANLAVASCSAAGQPFTLEEAQAYDRFYDATAEEAAPINYDAEGNYHLIKTVDGTTTADAAFADNNNAPWGFYCYTAEDGSYAPFDTYDTNLSSNQKSTSGTTWYMSGTEYPFVCTGGHFHPSNGISPAIVFTAPEDGLYFATLTVWRDKPTESNTLYLRSRLLEGEAMQCDKENFLFEQAYGTVEVDNVVGTEPQTLDFFIRLKAGQRFTFECGDTQSAGRTHISNLCVATCRDAGKPFTLDEAKAYARFYDAVGEEDEPTDNVFTKITSANNLVDGEKYLMVYEGGPKALGAISTTTTKYGLPVDVTITDNQITITDEAVDVLTLSGSADEGWSFASSLGNGFLSWTSGNSLNLNPKADTDAKWTITFDNDGNAVIVNSQKDGNVDRVLCYNINSPRFATYKSTSINASIVHVQLYKAGDVEEPEPVVSVTPPVITPESGTYDTELEVTITADESVEIWYAVGKNDYELYNEPFTLGESATISAFCMDVDGNQSEYVTAEYIIELPTITYLENCKAANEAATDERVDAELTLADALVTYASGRYAYVQDATGGFLIYGNSGVEWPFQVGDIVNGSVSGQLYSYHGLPEMANPECEIKVTSSGNDVVPTEVDAADLAAKPFNYISQFVVLKPGKFASDQWGPSSALRNVDFTVGETTVKMYDRFNISSQVELNTESDYAVSGIVIIYDNDTQVSPRTPADIVELGVEPDGTNLAAENAAAVASVNGGDFYRIFTQDENGNKYYMKADGYLTDKVSEATAFPLLLVSKDNLIIRTDVNEKAETLISSLSDPTMTGFNFGASFSNPNVESDKVTIKHEGHIKVDADRQNRSTYETQVFYLGAQSGKYAVRSTFSNSANWGANSYWTVTDGDGDLPSAEYSLTASYVWELESLGHHMPFIIQQKYSSNYMSINEGIKLAGEPMDFYFEQGNGGLAITDGNGNYVSMAGTNAWTMAASAEPYAWTVAPMPEGYYTIHKASVSYKNNSSGAMGYQLIGSNDDKVGSSCYADKSISGVGDKARWYILLNDPRPLLADAIEKASAQVEETGKVFQKTDEAGDALKTAIASAQRVLDNEDASIDDIKAANAALNQAVVAFNQSDIVPPVPGQPYSIQLNYAPAELYQNLGEEAKLLAEATPFTFEEADNGAYYLKLDDGTYMAIAAKKWNLTASADQKEAVTISFSDGAYHLQTSQGFMGADYNADGTVKNATDTDYAKFYSNKEKGVSTWIISEVTEPVEPVVFTKVTSDNNLVEGEKYLMVYETGNVALGAISASKTPYGLPVVVEVTDEQITITDQAVDVLTLVGSDADGWSFKSSLDEGFLSWTSGNSLTINPKADADAVWTIEFDENGNANIVNSTDEARNISYNTSSPRFATYGNMNQQRIQLYKAGDVEEPLVVNAPVIKPGTGLYTTAQRVSIKADEGATIIYTLNEGEEQEYTGPFTVSETTVITAYAQVGKQTSEPVSVTITIQPEGDAPIFVFHEAGDGIFTLATDEDITPYDNSGTVIEVNDEQIEKGIIATYPNTLTENGEVYLTGYRATARIEDSKGNVLVVKTPSDEQNAMNIAAGLFEPNEEYTVTIQPIVYYNFNQFCDGIYQLWEEGKANHMVPDEGDPESFHLDPAWTLNAAAEQWSAELAESGSIPYLGETLLFDYCDPMPYYVDNTPHQFIIKTDDSVTANVKALGNQEFKAFDPWGNDITAEFLARLANGTATRINQMAGTNANDKVYNMAGQRVSKPTKGVYIINGRRVAVK